VTLLALTTEMLGCYILWSGRSYNCSMIQYIVQYNVVRSDNMVIMAP